MWDSLSPTFQQSCPIDLNILSGIETRVPYQYLEACMPQWQVLSLTIMGIHQCPLIIRSCKWLDISTSIRTSQDVLGYLGTHWHQWWVCLALVNAIHQWPVIQWFLFMLDINTYTLMIRTVPLGFVAGEGYTFFLMIPSAITAAWLQPYESTIVLLSAFHIFLDFLAAVQIPPLHILWSNNYSSFKYNNSHIFQH